MAHGLTHYWLVGEALAYALFVGCQMERNVSTSIISSLELVVRSLKQHIKVSLHCFQVAAVNNKYTNVSICNKKLQQNFYVKIRACYKKFFVADDTQG